ncbi:MAG: murein transglycosylase domain-containing protein [Nitrospiraceae bacterium]
MKYSSAPYAIQILTGSLLLVTAGCETTDKILGGAESVLRSGTTRSVIDIATSKDPAEMARRRAENYGRDPEALIRDLRTIQRDFEKLMAALSGEVGKKWGQKEVKLPEQKKYVKYTQNYRSRAIVDFDTGNITVETLEANDPKASLKNAVVTTLLTPNDPRSVDLFTDKEVTLTSDKAPTCLDWWSTGTIDRFARRTTPKNSPTTCSLSRWSRARSRWTGRRKPLTSSSSPW